MLKVKHSKSMAGFTFTELLIALIVNAVLFAGLITIFLSNVNHYRTSINTNRLNQQLQTAMLIMTNEIRRAGYWSNAQSDLGGSANNNPFMASGTDITVNGSNNCILFTYDSNSDGSLPTIAAGSDDERYGFRLNNQALQARPYGAPFSCTATSTEWENITDTNIIQITNLTFTLNESSIVTGPGSKGIVLRSVDISITGQLTSTPAITKTITRHVRVMNDRITNP